MENFFLKSPNPSIQQAINYRKQNWSPIARTVNITITCNGTKYFPSTDKRIKLSKVSISESGDYMTARKCQIEILCIGWDAFEIVEKDFGFIDKNKKLTIQFEQVAPPGYAVAAAEISQTWEFRIIDPSFTLQDDGTILLAVRGIGAGATVESVNIGDAAFATALPGTTFVSDYNWENDVKQIQSITDYIHWRVQSQTNALTTIDFDILHGCQGLIADDAPGNAMFLTLKTASEVYEAPEQSVNMPSLIYVTLSGIVHLINTYYQPGEGALSSIKITCEPRGTVTYKTSDGSTFGLYSADPIRVFLPWSDPAYCSYIPKGAESQPGRNAFNFVSNPGYALPALQACSVSGGELGGIFINVDILETILKELGGENTDSTLEKKNPAKISIQSFFKKIFATVKELTGGAIDLSLRTDNDKTTPTHTEFAIVNARDQTTEVITPVAFSRLDGTTISLIVKSKITQELIAASFGSAPGTDGDESGTAAVGRQQASEGDTAAAKKGLPTWTDLSDARTRLAYGFFKDEDVNAAKGVLTRLITEQNTKEKAEQSTGIYPLELTLIIRGLDGFRFGDAITVNELPSRYKTPVGGTRIIFTVHEVEHQYVDKGLWETSLKTLLRMAPDNLYQSVSSTGNGVTSADAQESLQTQMSTQIQNENINSSTTDPNNSVFERLE